MKAIVVFLSLSIHGHAADRVQFKDHPFFKHMMGEWTSEGELKGADGKAFSFKEKWKGEFVGETTFAATGKREINGQSMNFDCTFIRDPATGRIEATQNTKAETAVIERFEVMGSADGSKLEMTALGSVNNEMLAIVLEFRQNDHDHLYQKMTFTDASGTAVGSSELVNQRATKP